MPLPLAVDESAVQSRMSRLSIDSRYHLTKLHPDIYKGKAALRWGIWNRPKIDMSQYYNYALTLADRGRLDRISKKFYDKEHYWWAIAMVNNIKDPFSEMIPGRVIQIPLLSSIERALSEGNPALFD